MLTVHCVVTHLDAIKAGFPHIYSHWSQTLFNQSVRKTNEFKDQAPIWQLEMWYIHAEQTNGILLFFLVLNKEHCCVSEGEMCCCLCLGHVCGELCREDGPLNHHRPQRGNDAGPTHQWRQPCGSKGIVAAECLKLITRVLMPYFQCFGKEMRSSVLQFMAAEQLR